MKLPIIITAITFIAIVLGTIQQNELKHLQQRHRELDQKIAQANQNFELAPGELDGSIAPNPTGNPRTLADEADSEKKNSITLEAAAFLSEAEALIASDSRLEAGVRLIPRLAFASTELLKEILMQVEAGGLDETPKLMAWQMIGGKLVKREPEEAMRMILEVSGRQEDLFPEMFQKWIDRHPAAAEKWYRETVASGHFPCEPAGLASAAETSIFGVIAKRDLSAAFDLIAAAAGEDQNSPRKHMFPAIEKSITSVDKWNRVAGLTLASDDPELRQQSFAILASKAFDHGKVGDQLERIDALGLEGEELGAFAVMAIRGAAHHNSPPMVEWGILKLPEPLVKQEVARLIDAWSRTYRPGVEDWVDSLPAGEVKDFALGRLGK